MRITVNFKTNLTSLESCSSSTLERELKMLTFMSLGNNHEKILICFFFLSFPYSKLFKLQSKLHFYTFFSIDTAN